MGKIHPAYGGGLDKYKLGEVPLSQNSDSISFWKYQVGNASAFNLTNVPVNITLPDGMRPTKLVLPTDYNSGKITYTLHRYVDAAHPDEITNGVLNSGQTTIDFTNLAGNVRSIQLTLATLDSGVDYTASDYSTSNGFRVYGYVSQKYANGTDVKVGDKLTSNLTIGDGSQHWTADQYVVAKKVQPISVTNYPYQKDTTPGAQMSGQLGLGWNGTNSNSDFANPTIYYVLPSNASFNSYKPISPKADVTSYKAKDGRTIVKVVYHNTTSQDFKYYGYDYLYLNNSADLPHSTSNYKIYLVVPDGMQVTGSNKVSSADLQYVENNANAYLVGSGNWIIESVKGTQIAEQSQGNKNADLTLAGESDNHGSNKMTYTGSVINNTNNELNNVTYDLNLPDTADGNSGFNFYLNEPVTVIDAATGKSLAGVQVKYSTTRVNLSENGQPTGGDFGTLPTDIHQVRAVQVILPSISTGQSVRVILNGIDPTIINDVNKTGYLSSSLYTTDNSLKPINVLPNSASASSIKVTGVLDKQKVTVNYIDKVTGQHLDSKSMTGLSGADANYTTKSSIDKYVGQHYVLYQDETNGADLVYDNDSSKDQVYNVYFTHGTQAATDSKTVHETIHYVYGPKQPRSGQAAADKTAEVTFTRQGTTDLVTGKTTWQDWDQKSRTFAAVLSPSIAGYTADQSQIDKQAVRAGDQDIVKTVTYTADQQRATVKYIDDVTGKTLQTKDLTGASDSDSGYNTNDTIADYKSQHYSVVSDNTDGNNVVFDHDDSVDQSYEVHLTHKTQAATNSKKIHETIHYVYGPQQPRSGQAAADKTAEVTGKTTWQDWGQKSQTFAAVSSPTIAGYTADQAQIDKQAVSAGDQDIVKTVTYTADQQKITVNYIDKVTGHQLDSKSMTGLSGTDANYTTKSSIDKYKGLHYVLDKDETKGQPLVYDNDSSKDQVYNVYFIHETVPASESKTVHETIHYVYGPNQPRSGQAAADKTAEVIFTRKGTTDLVTGKTDWQPWNQDSQTFVAVPSPNITGYMADQSQIDAQNVTVGDQDIVKTVTYTANPEIPNPSVPNVPNDKDGLKGKDFENASSLKGKSNNEVANNNQQLPQTGNDSNRGLGVVGLALTSIVSLIGLSGFKKKHD